MPVQTCFAFQAGWTKTGSGRKPCGLKSLGEGPMEEDFLIGKAIPKRHHAIMKADLLCSSKAKPKRLLQSSQGPVEKSDHTMKAEKNSLNI